MNRDQAEGKWDQIKGRGEITDDDFKKAEGSMDKLCGVIRKKFDNTGETLETKIDTRFT